MSKRDDFVHLGIDQLGKPVLWGQKGPDVFDCSGLCTWLLKQVGGPDLAHHDNAQALFDATRALGSAPTDTPLPGDPVFYGIEIRDPVTDAVLTPAEENIVHVVVWLAGGNILSADGATSRITDLATARAHGCAVRLHQSVRYRLDTPYIVPHRNTLLDNLDGVTR